MENSHVESHDRYPAEEISGVTALRILDLAHPYFLKERKWGFGELTLKYYKGECKIWRIPDANAPFPRYRVQVMSSGITVEDKPIKGSPFWTAEAQRPPFAQGSDGKGRSS